MSKVEEPATPAPAAPAAADGAPSPPIPSPVREEYSEGLPLVHIGLSDDVVGHELNTLLDSQMATMRDGLYTLVRDMKGRMAAQGDDVIAAERKHGMKQLAAKQRALEASEARVAALEARTEKLEHILKRCGTVIGDLKQRQESQARAYHCWGAWIHFVKSQKELKARARQIFERLNTTGLARKVLRHWQVEALRQKVEVAEERFADMLAASTKDLNGEIESMREAHAAQHAEMQTALAREREARVQVEEEMRQAFLRGVCAMNLEAVNVFKQGVPHPALNANFPVLPPGATPVPDEPASAPPVPQAGGGAAEGEIASLIRDALGRQSAEEFHSAVRAGNVLRAQAQAQARS
ncbi:unnamed protein product [Pedinophyceae sp. YPF-701]|nr:unnamed protein product [Pedinophyceae sp. YPF-701]